jgi:hypothetical protein
MQAMLAMLGPELVAQADWRAADPGGRTLMDVDAPSDLAVLGDGDGDELS